MKEYTIGQWIKDNNINTSKDINCSNNNLTSLEGLPENFNSKLYCYNNNFTSLDGINKLEIRNLYCDLSPKEIEKEYIRLGLIEYTI